MFCCSTALLYRDFELAAYVPLKVNSAHLSPLLPSPQRHQEMLTPSEASGDATRTLSSGPHAVHGAHLEIM